jgi:hypothetical protein
LVAKSRERLEHAREKPAISTGRFRSVSRITSSSHKLWLSVDTKRTAAGATNGGRYGERRCRNI